MHGAIHLNRVDAVRALIDAGAVAHRQGLHDDLGMSVGEFAQMTDNEAASTALAAWGITRHPSYGSPATPSTVSVQKSATREEPMHDAFVTYGHRHLHFFFVPLFEADATHLRHRGRTYVLADVKVIVWMPPGSQYVLGTLFGPGATIQLPGGPRLRIAARSFCRRGETSPVSFFGGESEAYLAFLRRIGSF